MPPEKRQWNEKDSYQSILKEDGAWYRITNYL